MRKQRTCVIIDDEQRGREYLSGLLARHFPEIREEGQAVSVNESIALIDGTRPDVVFLDIELIGGTAFDVLDKIDTPPSVIIFTTALSNYRTETRRFSGARFLLKPISIADLRSALVSKEGADQGTRAQADAG